MTTPPAPSKTTLARNKIKIVLLESVHDVAVQTLHAAGYTQVETYLKALQGDDLAAALADAHMVGIRSRTQLTEPVLDAATKLMAVGCFCIGTNQVDLGAAEARGVPVFNAPFSNTRSVAELVVAEAVLLLRGIPRRNARAHRGGWDKSVEGSHEARGKRLGVVGYGHIGSQVGVLAEGFGMEVVFYDIEAKLSLGNSHPTPDLQTLLETSDVVTLHVPETPETAGMIGAAELARMRPGASLINASRGSVVDIEALVAALTSGHLAGAAVDVFPTEPKSNDDPFVSALIGLDQVLLTPHIGGSTAEAQRNIGLEVADKLVRYSDNGSTISAVNFPVVSLPTFVGKHRLLHIHANRPGMLSKINQVLFSKDVNVAAQYLNTTEKVGYVVADVQGDVDTLALKDELGAIEGTIRSRLLY